MPDILINKDVFFTASAKEDTSAFFDEGILPDNIYQSADLHLFLKTEQGTKFCHKVRELVADLVAWCNHEGITVNYDSIDKFLSFFNPNKKQGTQPFHLYKNGIPLLAKIIQLLKNSDNHIANHTKRLVAINLVNDLGSCAPGAYTHIQNAYLQFPTSLNLIMANIKRQIIEQIIKIHILPEMSGITASMEIHLINSFCNHLATELGILTPVEDFFAPDKEITKDEIPKLIPLVYDISTNLIVDKILLELEGTLDEFIEVIKKNGNDCAFNPQPYVNMLERALDRYGKDCWEGFKLPILFDQEKLLNDQYDISPDIHSQLVLTILARLDNSNYLNFNKQIIMLPLHKVNGFFVPQEISFSFCVDAEGRKPLVAYFIDKYFNGNKLQFVEVRKNNDFINFLKLVPEPILAAILKDEIGFKSLLELISQMPLQNGYELLDCLANLSTEHKEQLLFLLTLPEVYTAKVLQLQEKQHRYMRFMDSHQHQLHNFFSFHPQLFKQLFAIFPLQHQIDFLESLIANKVLDTILMSSPENFDSVLQGLQRLNRLDLINQIQETHLADLIISNSPKYLITFLNYVDMDKRGNFIFHYQSEIFDADCTHQELYNILKLLPQEHRLEITCLLGYDFISDIFLDAKFQSFYDLLALFSHNIDAPDGNDLESFLNEYQWERLGNFIFNAHEINKLLKLLSFEKSVAYAALDNIMINFEQIEFSSASEMVEMLSFIPKENAIELILKFDTEHLLFNFKQFLLLAQSLGELTDTLLESLIPENKLIKIISKWNATERFTFLNDHIGLNYIKLFATNGTLLKQLLSGMSDNRRETILKELIDSFSPFECMRYKDDPECYTEIMKIKRATIPGLISEFTFSREKKRQAEAEEPNARPHKYSKS